MTRAEIAILILKSWRRWPALARILLRYGPPEIRFHLLCWWHGYTVREVRRLGRLYRLTGELPHEATHPCRHDLHA